MSIRQRINYCGCWAVLISAFLLGVFQVKAQADTWEIQAVDAPKLFKEFVSRALAVDSSGRAYVAGETDSPDFPTENPYQTDQGSADAFVVKFGTTSCPITVPGDATDERRRSAPRERTGDSYRASPPRRGPD